MNLYENANYGSGNATSVNSLYDATEVAFRIKTILNQNPYMSDQPSALMALAQSPVDILSLADNSAAMYGMQTADKLRQSMETMTEAQQRSMFNAMTPAQQQALGQIGYNAPKRDEDAWYEQLVAPFDPVLKTVGGGLGGAAKALQLDHALDALIWMSERPAHLYRTIRTMPEWSQFAALAGGLAAGAFLLNPIGLGIAGVAALSGAFTGGTLAAAGALGGGVILGATAAAAITNPDDWANAFTATYRGEKTFDRDSQTQAQQLLGDPRLVNLARSVAHALPNDFNVFEFATDMAGNRDVSYEAQVKYLDEVVKRMAQPNTPQYQVIYQGLSDLMQESSFQKAVNTLQNGKISPGRDIAGFFQLEPGSSSFNFVSGIIDGAFTFAVDPLLVGSKVASVASFARRGIAVMGGAEAVARFEKIVESNKGVRRTYEYIAEAVNKNDASIIQKYVPSMREQYVALLGHRSQLLKSGSLENGLMTADDVIDWVKGTMELKPLMEGYGTVRGVNNGVLLAKVGPVSESWKRGASAVRAFTNGLTDARNEKNLLNVVQETGDIGMARLFSPLLFPKLADDVNKLEVDLLRSRLRLIDEQWDALPEAQRTAIETNWVASTGARSPKEYLDKEYSDLYDRWTSIAGDLQYTSDDLTPELLEKFALASENGDWARFARRVGRRLGAVEIKPGAALEKRGYHSTSPFAAVGDLFSRATTMAPSGKVLSLSGPRAIDDMKAFTELAALTGMPQWMRREYMNLVLWQPTVGTRMNAVLSFFDNMLTIGGLRETAEGAELLDKYLRRVKHTYAAGGLDTLPLFGETSKQAVFLGEIADHIVMPDLTELRKAASTGYIAHLFGIVDRPMVEAFQAKIWKPSVLLRFGFIPRAAGEEFLSFAMRGGIGSIGQELHGYSLAQYEKYQEVAEKFYKGGTLTPAEQTIFETTKPPVGLRTVSRMLNRTSYGHPMLNKLDEWQSVYRRIQKQGFGQRDRAERVLSQIAGTDMPLYQLADGAASLAKTRQNMPIAAMRRLNMATAVDSIVLGNPNSWRRMAVGGVNDDIVHAANHWFMSHGRAIMQEIGAATNGPVGNFYDPQHYITVEIQNQATGQYEDVLMERVPGERILLSYDDGGSTHYANAVHEQMHRPLDDELGQRVVVPHVSRMLPNSVTPAAAEALVSQMALINKAMEGRSRVQNMVIAEFLSGEPDYDRLIVMADRMAGPARASTAPDAKIPKLAQAIYRLDPQDVTLGRLIQQLSVVQDKQMVTILQNHARPVVDALNKMTLADRRQMQAVLSFMPPSRVEDIRRVGASNYFYTSDDAGTAWSKAVTAMRDDLFNNLQNPYFANRVGHMQDMAVTNDELAARFEVATNREGYATTWKPAISSKNAGKFAARGGIDAALRRASAADQQMIQANRSFVVAYMDSRSEGFDPLLADRALSEAMSRVFGRADGTLAVDLPETILTDRVPVGTRLFQKQEGGRAVAWSFPQDMEFSARLASAQLDGTAKNFVDRYIEAVRLSWSKGRREALLPRTVRDVDGQEVSKVWKLNEATGTYTPVEPGTLIKSHGVFFDSNFKRIEFGDVRFFERQVIESTDDLMWEALGPMIRDITDEQFNRILTMKKQGKIAVGEVAGDPKNIRSVRSYHSKISHIRDAGADAPNFIDSMKLRAPSQGTWEKFVRHGFDKVIGPAIDALARRPMAFHFFTQRYIQNRSLRGWLMDQNLMRAVNDVALRAAPDFDKARKTADAARNIGRFVTGDVDQAAKWSDMHALSWLRSHDEEELASVLRQVEGRLASAIDDGALTVDQALKLENSLTHMRTLAYRDVEAMLPNDMTGEDFLSYIMSRTTPSFMTKLSELSADDISFATVADHVQELASDPVLGQLRIADWKTIGKGYSNYNAVIGDAADAAKVAAINDMLPFIDSHEFKTQFAEYGKGFLPFWYAEENFLKRWGRTLALEGPQVIRKMQLTYMGLRTAGVIRTDQSGRDWFVYPGSNLLQEAINKLPFLPDVPVDVMFQSSTDSVLPGMNSRFGTPQFGPLGTIPMEVVTWVAPELQTQQRYLLGDLAASKSVLEQVVPAGLINTFHAVLGTEGNQRYASAMMAAIASLEASNNWIPDNATPGQIEDALDRARDHARIIVFAQALGGWFAPGPLSQLNSGEETPFLGIGLDVKDPGQILNSIYQERVRALGIEEGTLQFLQEYPNAELQDIVNPLAYTISRNVSASGAPLPSTDTALAFFDEHSNYMSEFPDAGPWLLPISETANDTHSQYAYDQQTINGLRRRRTPEEFVAAMRFKKASGKYFRFRDEYLAMADEARTNKRSDALRTLNAAWSAWSSTYKAANPVFASELEGSDARQRRGRVIEQMRTIMSDPDAPTPPHYAAMKQMMRTFDQYLTFKGQLSLNRSTESVATVLRLKTEYEKYMNEIARSNPAVQSFWVSVLRPESELD